MSAYTNPALPSYFNPAPATLYDTGAGAGPSTTLGNGKKKNKKAHVSTAPGPVMGVH
jgi:hypothetical protein